MNRKTSFDQSKHGIVTNRLLATNEQIQKEDQEYFDEYLQSIYEMGDSFDQELLIEEIDNLIESNKEILPKKLALCYKALTVFMLKNAPDSNRDPVETCFKIIWENKIDPYYKIPAFTLLTAYMEGLRDKGARRRITEEVDETFISHCTEIICQNSKVLDPAKKFLNVISRGKDAEISQNICEIIIDELYDIEKENHFTDEISLIQAQFLSVFLTARDKETRHLAKKEWNAFWERKLNATDTKMIGPGTAIKGQPEPG